MSNSKAKLFNEKYNLNDVNLNNFTFISKEEMELKEKAQISGKTKSVFLDVVKRFFKNKWNVAFTIFFILIILAIIFVPIFSHYSSNKNVSNINQNLLIFKKPSWIHNYDVVKTNLSFHDYGSYMNSMANGKTFDGISKANFISKELLHNGQGQAIGWTITFRPKIPATFLGTDSVGRDVFTRLFTGARWSLLLAFAVATIETVIGTVVGIYIGFHVGKKVDTLAMRVIEVFQSVPGLLWMFIFAMVIGTSFFSMMFVLILVGWVGPVYIARMFTLKVKDEEFIIAAESLGVSKAGRLYRHILPNIIGRLLVSFVHRIPAVIFTETTLIFLGMSVGGNGQSSIGNLISDARGLEAINHNPMYAISVSLFLLSITISLQIIANGIRDAFDPKTGGR